VRFQWRSVLGCCTPTVLGPSHIEVTRQQVDQQHCLMSGHPSRLQYVLHQRVALPASRPDWQLLPGRTSCAMFSAHAAEVALCRYFRRGFDPSANSTGGPVRQPHSTAGAAQQRGDRQRDAKQAGAATVRGRSSASASAVARDRHGHVPQPSHLRPQAAAQWL